MYEDICNFVHIPDKDVDDDANVDGSFSNVSSLDQFEDTFKIKRSENFDKLNMSSDKEKIIKLTTDHLLLLGKKKHFPESCEKIEIPPFVKFLSGGPGCGKSFVSKHLNGFVKHCKLGNTLCAAYMGIAAYNISGHTINSGFLIAVKKNNSAEVYTDEIHDLDPIKLDELIRKLDLNNTVILIIDEISQVPPSLLFMINKRIQQALQNDSPFGNIATILCGDFRQGTPIKATSIAEAVITLKRMYNDKDEYNRKQENPKYKESSLTRAGADLFLQHVECIFLTVQNRSKDPVHNDLITRMSKGQSITWNDIKYYKTMNTSDSSEFLFAPILVLTNLERIHYNHTQIQAFAKINKSVVIRWRFPEKFCNLAKEPEKFDDPIMYEYFTICCRAYLTSNLNTYIGMANGATVYMHSISFIDESRRIYVEENIKNEVWSNFYIR